jgi:hypothetical protein
VKETVLPAKDIVVFVLTENRKLEGFFYGRRSTRACVARLFDDSCMLLFLIECTRKIAGENGKVIIRMRVREQMESGPGPDYNIYNCDHQRNQSHVLLFHH